MQLRHLGVHIKEPLSILYDRALQKIKPFLRQLSMHFPNLVNLKFDYQNISKDCPYSDDIAQVIPSLRSFTLAGAGRPIMFLYEHLHKFRNLNGQLESLALIGGLFIGTIESLNSSENFIEYLDASLPQLTYLEMNYVPVRVPVRVPVLALQRPNRFKNLKKLTFGTHSWSIYDAWSISARNLYLSFFGENIETMELYSFDCRISNFVERITRFKKLKELKLHVDKYRRSRWQLGFFDLVWSSAGMCELICNHNQLMKIVIQWEEEDVYFNNEFKDFK